MSLWKQNSGTYQGDGNPNVWTEGTRYLLFSHPKGFLGPDWLGFSGCNHWANHPSWRSVRYFVSLWEMFWSTGSEHKLPVCCFFLNKKSTFYLNLWFYKRESLNTNTMIKVEFFLSNFTKIALFLFITKCLFYFTFCMFSLIFTVFNYFWLYEKYLCISAKALMFW